MAATHLCHHWGHSTAMPRSGLGAAGHSWMPWKELQPLDHHQQLKPNITRWEILVLGGWGIWKNIIRIYMENLNVEICLWVVSQKVKIGFVGVKKGWPLRTPGDSSPHIPVCVLPGAAWRWALGRMSPVRDLSVQTSTKPYHRARREELNPFNWWLWARTEIKSFAQRHDGAARWSKGEHEIIAGPRPLLSWELLLFSVSTSSYHHRMI